MLTLFALNELSQPIHFDHLFEVTDCDEGVDYFVLKQAVAELVEQENIAQTDDLLSLTPRGQKNAQTCATELPPTLRKQCATTAKTLKNQLLHQKYVNGELREDGTLSLHFSDQSGLIFDLAFLYPNPKGSKAILEAFTADPALFYDKVSTLVQELATTSPTQNKE